MSKIKNLRKLLGMTQEEFGKQLGISQGFVSELEKGSKEPSETLLIAMQYQFNLTTGWFEDKENGLNIEQFVVSPIITDINKWYNGLSEEEKIWFKVEFSRHFLEFNLWLKNRESG
jgi:transcriptional regulator with XRE-family HTH domain